jgi:hypothetical protein
VNKSQPEFLKFKDIKENLELLGPQKETVPARKKDLATSRSLGRLPLGIRLYNQAFVYKEHKQKLKEHFDQERYQKEMKEASFQPKLVAKIQQYRHPSVKPEDVLLWSLQEKQNNLERLKKE